MSMHTEIGSSGMTADGLTVATFYKFFRQDDVAGMQRALHAEGEALGLKGTILLADEGINGTICGTDAALREFVSHLLARQALADMPVKYSVADSGNPVFYRWKVRIKPEIVSFGQPGLSPGEVTGEHVNAVRWNELLNDPDVVVIDTRNDYETDIGTFEGAIAPGTRSFREFPEFVRTHLDPVRNPRVAMCCTGGVRCEKASAYLLQQGFEAVYQLDGGILKYLEEVTPEASMWRGECFVFDQRVAVDENLAQGEYLQCFACRHPLTAEEAASPDYVEGVHCPRCVGQLTVRQKSGFAERRRQIELAEARGEMHIAAPGRVSRR